MELSGNGEKTIAYLSNDSASQGEDKTLKTLKADMVVHGAGRVPIPKDWT